MEQIEQVKISDIKVGEHEQRLETKDDDVSSLAKSIKRIGILVPLIVVGEGDGYLLVAGHRRLEAAKQAGLATVPAIIKEEDRTIRTEVTFAENFFRKDLSPIELACAIRDSFKNETMTIAEIAEGFNRKEHWVHSMIAIASWPEDVQIAVHKESISVAAASNLALIEDDTYRDFLIRNAEEGGATARTTAAWLQAWRAMQPQEEAIQAEQVPQGPAQVPLVPQAPCLCCSQIFPVNMMSHVPMCGECIMTIRKAGIT